MPLCGLKKSKTRDHSPPYSADLRELDNFKDRVQGLEQDLRNTKDQKDKLAQECTDLRKQLDEVKVPADISVGLEPDEIKRKFEAQLHDAKDELKRYAEKAENLESEVEKIKGKVTKAEELLEKEKEIKEKAENEVERLKRTVEDKEDALKEAHKSLTSDISAAVPKSPVRDIAPEWKTKIEAAQAELAREREERMNKERELSRLSSEKTAILSETEKLSAKVKELEVLKATGEDEITKVKETSENNLRNQLKNMEDTIASYQQKLDDEKLAKENALSRLTEAASTLSTFNNSDVSDQGDSNQKFIEQYMELYNNEWAVALENLQKLENPEDEAVKILLELLIETYKHCRESSESQINKIEEDMFLPPMVNDPKSPGSSDGEPKSPTPPKQQTPSSKIPRFGALQKQKTPGSERKESHGSSNGHSKLSFKSKKSLKSSFARVKGEKCPDIPEEVMKGVRAYRMRVTKHVIPVVQEELNQNLRQMPELGDQVLMACVDYINKCCEICWTLCVQDPPCHLSWDIPSDGIFDSDVYSAYADDGSHVEFVIWPTLYSEKCGSVLAKGVAQGTGS